MEVGKIEYAGRNKKLPVYPARLKNYLNEFLSCPCMDFKPLEYFTNYVDAHILSGRLQEEGIECWLKDENTVTIFPIWTSAVGGIKLMVAEDQFEQATDLLNKYYSEKRKNFTCPRCGSGNIEYISSPRDSGNWLSVLMGFLFFNFAMPIKIWKCFNCKKEFKEPSEQQPGEWMPGEKKDQFS